MTESSRQLKVGDRVTTDYDRSYSGITEHVITARQSGAFTQSGLVFKVDPPIRLTTKDSWIDADWFKPAYTEKEQFANDLVKAWESSGDAT